MSDQPSIYEKLLDVERTQIEFSANQNRLNEILADQGVSLKKIKETLTKSTETLLRNTLTVEEHERRSTLLEAQFSKQQLKINAVTAHIHKVQGIGDFLKWSGITTSLLMTLLGGIYGLIKLLGL